MTGPEGPEDGESYSHLSDRELMKQANKKPDLGVDAEQVEMKRRIGRKAIPWWLRGRANRPYAEAFDERSRTPGEAIMEWLGLSPDAYIPDPPQRPESAVPTERLDRFNRRIYESDLVIIGRLGTVERGPDGLTVAGQSLEDPQLVVEIYGHVDPVVPVPKPDDGGDESPDSPEGA